MRRTTFWPKNSVFTKFANELENHNFRKHRHYYSGEGKEAFFREKNLYSSGPQKHNLRGNLSQNRDIY